MKKDDRLIDELLKEHGRGGADEGFLRDVEERIDAEGKVVQMRHEPSAGNRWALGAGVAAVLAVGVFGAYYLGEKRGDEDIVAYEVAAPANQMDEIGDYENARRQRVEKPIVSEEVERKPAAPSSSVGKVLGANASSPTEIPVPTVREAQPSLDFGGGDSFGDGWAGGSGQGGGGAAKIDGRGNNRGLAKGSAVRRRAGEAKNNYAYDPNGFKVDRDEKEELIRRQIPVRPGGGFHPKKQKVRPSAERYGALIENKFEAPVDERSALSTFAVDVDTASYANVRRMLGQGVKVPKDSVRIEEMVNYFDYEYPQPDGVHPFSVNVDSMACPWDEGHRLVRIGVQGKEIVRTERPAANLVFLLDVSGSMSSSDKLPLLKQSMGFLLEELDEKDSVSIVVYAGASGLALPATKMTDEGRKKVAQAMDRLSAGGSTAGGQGIKLAYEVAKKEFVKGGVNRIILATDGDFNVGTSDDASLTKLVKEKAKEGTYLSVLGFGSGNINDSMLEKITNNGNGNYNYIDTVKEGRKVLLEDMMGTMVTIAKDVKVQVVMNPKKVKAYRLIGYSNRMLPPEAFLDKKVDAGEIGAGHTVTALYEIIPADGKPFGPEIDGGRYFEQPEVKPNPALKDSDETMFVKLAYKKPDEQMDDESTYLSVPFTDAGGGVKEASADLKFAGAVGLFGMVLRDSEFKGKGDLGMVLELAQAGKGNDGKGQRGEFMGMVRKLSERE